MDESRAPAPPEAVTSAVPEQLGEFQIVRVLGQGGSGVVYAARWGHREVALKVLRDNLVATDTERRRFFDEARSLSEIKHPSVVKVLSFGELPSGRPYLAMELLEGETLADRVSRGPIAIPAALALFDQLTGAVDAMHQRGLVHRDLKPENVVLVTGGEFLVLLDFGIAKEVDAKPSTVTQEGGIRGTPAYMAPERFFGQPASQSTDVYELAVTLFAMLVGRLPWESATDPNDRLDPKRPSALGVELPGQLEAQLLGALSTRPEVRPGSALELARNVRAAANLPAAPMARATAPLPPAPTPAQNPHVLGVASTIAHTTRTRRRVGLAAAGAVLLVAVSAAVALALWSKGGTATTGEGEGEADDGVAVVQSESKESTAEEPDEPTRRSADDSALFGATGFHPADTRILIGLRARELRNSEALASLFDRAKESPYARVANLYVSACKVDVFEDIDWITLGVSGAERDIVEIVVSGNWTRDRIEGCMGDLSTSFGLGKAGNIERDGDITTVHVDESEMVVGWIDDRTAMFSSREEANAAWMRSRLAKQGSLTESGLLSKIVGRIDTRSTLWLAGESDPELAADVLGKITPPELVWFNLGISDAVEFTGGAAFATGAQSAEAEAEFARWSKTVIEAEPVYDMFLRTVELKTEADNVLIEAKLDKGLTMLVVRGLETELGKQL